MKENLEKYDVIVIGAGLGGLVCGAYLAKNKLKTLVVEQYSVPGGYCTSFKRKGFTFDAAVHFLEGLEEGGEFYQILKDLGIEKEIEFTRMDPLYRIFYPDESISIPADLDEYIALLSKKFPEEKGGISKLFDTIKKLAEDIQQLPTSLKIHDIVLFPLKFPLIFKYYKKTFAEMMADFIKDAKLKSIISAGWPCAGLPPSKVSALYMCSFLHAAHVESFYRLKGGAQTLADLLAKALARYGGVLQLKTKATRIMVENNRVIGIETSKGEKMHAKCVVSNIDARQNFFNLIGREKLNRKFSERLERMEPSISFFQVWLGIDIDPRDKGVNESEIFYYSSYDTNEIYDSCVAGEFEDMCGISIPTLLDPDLAPEGKHVMSIIFPVSYDFENQWRMENNKRGEEYQNLKDEVTTRLIKTAERVVPGLPEHIVVSEAATPPTFERYTLNYKGAAYGWAHVPDQVGTNRLQPKTHIKGLYLAGHWTTPGGGTITVALSGKTTAKMIINELF